MEKMAENSLYLVGKVVLKAPQSSPIDSVQVQPLFFQLNHYCYSRDFAFLLKGQVPLINFMIHSSDFLTFF